MVALGLALLAPSLIKPLYEPPILMYHRIGDPTTESGAGLFVTPETFERQMEFLKAHSYQVWSLSRLIQAIKNSENIPMNVVVITFDDGYLDNFKNAFPILKKMDFPATIFMITDNIGKPDWLSEEDLKILEASGIEIGSHTAHHEFLPQGAPENLSHEIVDSKKTLEEILGHPVTLFSYPAGGVTDAIRDLVREAGYEGAVTTNYGKGRLDPYMLRRIKVSDAHGSLFNFWVKTTGFYRLGKKKIDTASYGAH